MKQRKKQRKIEMKERKIKQKRKKEKIELLIRGSSKEVRKAFDQKYIHHIS